MAEQVLKFSLIMVELYCCGSSEENLLVFVLKDGGMLSWQVKKIMLE